jgi:NarL family two-component system response regulator LiaR
MTESTPIHALIVSSQFVVRRGLEAICRLIDDFEVVGEAANAAQAIGLIEALKPDVLLVDVVDTDPVNISDMARIRREYPDTRILVLSSDLNTALITAVINAGANSWVLKNVTMGSLASAIRSTMDGQSVFAPEVVTKLLDISARARPQASPLTERETQVLGLMGEGLTNQEIAAVLVISHATVKYHVTNILAKLGAAHRSQAIVIAMKQGLIKRG